MENAITLKRLTEIITGHVLKPDTQNVWVIAETQDVAVRGGHCYMELLQKDDQGRQLARMRGCCWANVYSRIAPAFYRATGQQFTSGMKVMLCVSVSMHPVFGMSLVVNSINPDFTLGDLMRRRKEIIDRLTAEGIINDNRALTMPAVVQRIAVVSARGAAGYGDFINQLYGNASRLRFTTTLFEAKMQGEMAPPSIVNALEMITLRADEFDCVVIIRGGGATSDLQAFEDYNLAAAVAQFPLPVAIGIGHERDITVLDWVANTRLKTPTAVAEWLVAKGENLLGALVNAANKIHQSVTARIAGDKEQLAQALALLPVASRGAIERQQARLNRATLSVASISGARIQPSLTRLAMIMENINNAAAQQLRRQGDLLDAKQKLLDVLSPDATLRRGYSITRVDGHAVTSVDAILPGTLLEITLADGTLLAHTP